MKDPRPTGHPEVAPPPVRVGEPARSGARIGVEALFRAHAAFVAAFLVRLGVASADVEDLVQEVFLIAHRKGGFEPGAAQPRSWLGAIAVRVASTRRRSLRRRREELDGERQQTVACEGPGPESQLATRQALSRVERALDSLDEDHRGVFVLYELENESCTAIAAAFGLPVGTVYSRLHKARKRFSEAHAALLAAEPEVTTTGATGAVVRARGKAVEGT